MRAAGVPVQALLGCALQLTGGAMAGLVRPDGSAWFCRPDGTHGADEAARSLCAALQAADDPAEAVDRPVLLAAGWRGYVCEPVRDEAETPARLCLLFVVPPALNASQRAALRSLAAGLAGLLQPAHDDRLRQLAALLPGVLYQYCDDGERRWFPWINERSQDVFGVAPEALRDDASALLDRIHDEDRPGMRETLPVAGSRLVPWHCEYRLWMPDGRLRWLESRAVPERRAEGGLTWHGFTTDVSERKLVELALRASEERWQMAAAAAGIGIKRVELEEPTVWLDAQAQANHGVTGAESIPLADFLCRVPEADRAELGEKLQQALEQRTRLEVVYRYERPDGRVRWLETQGRAHYDAQGRPQMLIGISRDVTAQQDAVQLQLDKREAERANRAKSELLSRVSHELRTPLNGILGFAQLMALDREAPLAAAQQRRLDGVQRAGKHLLGLVNDVLDLTRIEGGEVELTLRPVDLRRALDVSLVLVQPLAATHGVQLPTVLPPAPCWVRADARALEQVLMNLLSNAIQYNRPDGRVTVEVDAAGERVAIAVCDEGAGLAEAQLQRLFKPFERLGADRRNSGSGLGLVIARELAQAMGGYLVAQSTPGRGSRFTLALSRAAAGEDSLPGVLATMPAPLAADRAPYRVLYIEDEPLNALLMEEVFRAQPGWDLEVARDGTSGVARVRESTPDIVLIDMNLPDMNGLQVIGQLRTDSATAGMHCVALSADAMPEQMQAAREAGFDDYWTKPIDVARMLQTVEQAITTRKTGAQGAGSGGEALRASKAR